MTNTDNERKAFEAWASRIGYLMEKHRTGHYDSDMTEGAWEGWLARAEAEGWRPISEAPRDGSMFLGWVSAIQRGENDDGSYREADISDYDFCKWRADAYSEEGGLFENMMGDIGDLQIITHWRPLPAPPKEDFL